MEFRILAVDDERSMLALYSRMFPAGRYKLSLAGSVADALKLMESGTYDLLISDLLFSDGTGLELIRRFREQGAGRSILVTGSMPEEALTLLAKKEDLVRVFGRPFDLGGLLQVVERFAAV